MEQLDETVTERPGQQLIRHSLLNAVGQGLPILAGLVSVPLLLKIYGTERVGLLTLVWAVIGYASLFDFGVGRALTQLVAERRQNHNEEQLGDLIWSALIALLGVGIAFGIVGFAIAPWLTGSSLSISPDIRPDARLAFQILAAGIPVVVVTTGVRGVLEAYERFDLVNAVRVPMGISMFIGPLLIAPFSRTLAAAVVAVWLGRAGALIAQMVMMRRILPSMRGRPRFTSEVLHPIARYGAWMTVSNILSPLMTQADRFFIGSILSASVVAYYTAPYEMMTRIMAAVALAVATSLFPAFARWRDREHADALFRRGLRLTAMTFVPLIITVIVFAHPILQLWLGAEFAAKSTVVLRLLGAGVLLNGLAQIPFAHIQAVGRADLTAKIHIAEAPIYLAVVFYLIRNHGIEGAALAWSGRMLVDTALLFVVSRRLLARTDVAVTVAPAEA